MKRYKIYEVVTTSLEARSFYHDYSYYTLNSCLLRDINHSNADWKNAEDVRNGFETFEAAEEWLLRNQEKWVRYTIQLEYYKDE